MSFLTKEQQFWDFVNLPNLSLETHNFLIPAACNHPL